MHHVQPANISVAAWPIFARNFERVIGVLSAASGNPRNQRSHDRKDKMRHPNVLTKSRAKRTMFSRIVKRKRLIKMRSRF